MEHGFLDAVQDAGAAQLRRVQTAAFVQSQPHRGTLNSTGNFFPQFRCIRHEFVVPAVQCLDDARRKGLVQCDALERCATLR